MPDEVYDFGARLKKLRKEKNLTQKDVANKLNLHSATVGKYERNVLSPPLDILSSLAMIYRTSTDYLLNIDKHITADMTGLTESQQELIKKMIDEFRKSNS